MENNSAPMMLTPKQSQFVAEYLIDLNATQAAIRAGYSTDSARDIGYENLTKPDIQDAIAQAMQQRAERTQVTADQVLQEYAKVAFLDIRRLFDETGSIKPVEELDDRTAAAVSGLEVEELFEGRGEKRKHIGRLHKIKLADKMRALEGLARHLGMFNDSLEVKGKIQSITAVETYDTVEEAMAALKEIF